MMVGVVNRYKVNICKVHLIMRCCCCRVDKTPAIKGTNNDVFH